MDGRLWQRRLGCPVLVQERILLAGPVHHLSAACRECGERWTFGGFVFFFFLVFSRFSFPLRRFSRPNPTPSPPSLPRKNATNRCFALRQNGQTKNYSGFLLNNSTTGSKPTVNIVNQWAKVGRERVLHLLALAQ